MVKSKKTEKKTKPKKLEKFYFPNVQGWITILAETKEQAQERAQSLLDKTQ